MKEPLTHGQDQQRVEEEHRRGGVEEGEDHLVPFVIGNDQQPLEGIRNQGNGDGDDEHEGEQSNPNHFQIVLVVD